MLRRSFSSLSRSLLRSSPPTAALVYKAPTKDLCFLLNDVHKMSPHWERLEKVNENPEWGALDADFVESFVDSASKFSESIFPSYITSDAVGAKHDPATKVITAPPGFKDAYRQYSEGGWNSVSVPQRYGGQAMPASLNLAKTLMNAEANWTWSMLPLLSQGAMNTLIAAATSSRDAVNRAAAAAAADGNAAKPADTAAERMAALYVPKLCSGEWLGTMCLSEPDCGTDLAQVKSIASPLSPEECVGDAAGVEGAAAYRLKGTKIWITNGDHDITDNIVHIVLARTPDAPPGTRGLSLFLVPKYLESELSKPVEQRVRNLHAARIETKLGIHGSPTCQMEFVRDDGSGSIGWRIGELHQGLQNMFVFMNSARIGVAGQGVASAELASQQAYAYALERRSGRFADGPRDEKAPADAIIHHPDVKRMVFFARAVADGGRWLLLRCGKAEDAIDAFRSRAAAIAVGDDVTATEGEDLSSFAGRDAAREGALRKSRTLAESLAFVTPIAKGFLTELGVEAASGAMQVFGGMGYVRETGVEQIFRDSRIGPIYEGTTGVQAMDLIGRKMLGDKLAGYTAWTKDVAETITAARDFVDANGGLDGKYGWLATAVGDLDAAVSAVTNAVVKVGSAVAGGRKSAMHAAAVDTLYAVGYCMLGQGWAEMATVAAAKYAALADKESDDAKFLLGKIIVGRFYLQRVLPRVYGHTAVMTNSDASVVGKFHAGLAFR